MRLSLRNKLVVAICVPLIGVYALMLAVEYHIGRPAAVAQMELHLTELARHEAARLDTRLASVAQVVRTTADLISLQPTWDVAKIDQVLRTNVRGNPGIFGMAMAFEPGMFRSDVADYCTYICRDTAGSGLKSVSLTPTEGYHYTRWDWYLLPKLLNKAVWTDPYFDKGGGNILMCTYCVPFYRQGRFCGVLTADLSLQRLRDEMSHVPLEGGYCMVLSRAGTFISHPDESYVMCESVFSLAEWYDLPGLFEAGRQMVLGRSGVRRILSVKTGEPQYVVFAPIESAGWSLAAAVPEKVVLAPLRLRIERQIGLAIAGLLLIVAIVVLVSVGMTRPIGRLAAVVQELAGGNLGVQAVGITSRDEIGQFAQTFNKMVTELKANVEERLRETAARQAVESELKVATEIQLSLMPRTFPPFPDRTEFGLHATYVPAKFMAGDYYDFFFVDEDVLGIVIADVSGKGVPAALFMAVVRTALRNFTSPERTPAEVLDAVNRAMVSGNDRGMFVTLFYGHYDVRTGELNYASAGHNPPYLARADKRLESLPATGPILAVLSGAQFDGGQAQLDPGDTLILYTDGVTEAHRRNEESYVMFGEAGLENLLFRVASQPVKTICETIARDADDFRRHEHQDDITLLVLRRNV